MRACSISSFGTVAKYCRNMKVPDAVRTDGTMIPARLSYRPRSRTTAKAEGMITSVGSIVVARMQTKDARNHHARNFASAYPVMALTATVSAVVTTATMVVFRK